MKLSYCFVCVLAIHTASTSPLTFIDHATESSFLAHCEGFDFSWGFHDGSASNRSLQATRSKIERLSTHADLAVNYGQRPLLDLHYRRRELPLLRKKIDSTARVFTGPSFLNLLRGRTLTIIGDSLGQQLWQGLLVDLDPYLSENSSETYFGNKTHLFYDYFMGQPQQVAPPAYLAGSRHYDVSNTTVKWCRSGVLNVYDMMHEPLSLFCLKDALFDVVGKVERTAAQLNRSGSRGPTDYLLIAAGAWYKPNDDPNYSYMEETLKGLRQYIDEMYKARILIDTYRPKGTRIIWRLNTHIGPIDELNAAGYSTTSIPRNNDVGAWDDPGSGATWVHLYNDVLRTLAEFFGDLVLDLETLSLQLLHFAAEEKPQETLWNETLRSYIKNPSRKIPVSPLVRTRARHLYYNMSQRCESITKNGTYPSGNKYAGVSVHKDSLHFLAGGVFRASNLLLHHVIAHDLMSNGSENIFQLGDGGRGNSRQSKPVPSRNEVMKLHGEPVLRNLTTKIILAREFYPSLHRYRVHTAAGFTFDRGFIDQTGGSTTNTNDSNNSSSSSNCSSSNSSSNSSSSSRFTLSKTAEIVKNVSAHYCPNTEKLLLNWHYKFTGSPKGLLETGLIAQRREDANFLLRNVGGFSSSDKDQGRRSDSDRRRIQIGKDPRCTDTHLFTPTVFNAKNFLRLLKNASLTIVGDSLGLQTLHALEADLYPFLSNDPERTFVGNGTYDKYEFTQQQPAKDEQQHTAAAAAAAITNKNSNDSSSSDNSSSDSSRSSSGSGGILPKSWIIANTQTPPAAPVMISKHPFHEAATRYYPLFDTTIKWCRPNTLSPRDFTPANRLYDYCLRDALFSGTDTGRTTSDTGTGTSSSGGGGGGGGSRRGGGRGGGLRQGEKKEEKKRKSAAGGSALSTGEGDRYLLLAVGAWYKPRQTRENQPMDYEAQLRSSLETFKLHMLYAREKIRTHGDKSVKVIWRLNTHHGPVDEINAFGLGKQGAPSHWEKYIWDDPEVGARWVRAFNHVVRVLARAYGDAVLDMHTVAQQLMTTALSSRTVQEMHNATLAKYINSTRGRVDRPVGNWKNYCQAGRPGRFPSGRRFGSFPVHSDSLHFCAGGVARAGNLLLHHVIANIVCFVTPEKTWEI